MGIIILISCVIRTDEMIYIKKVLSSVLDSE